jgi:pantothenate kinase-related protein Tda10
MSLFNRIRALTIYLPSDLATRNVWRRWCEQAVLAEAKKKPVNTPSLTWVLM